MDGCSSLMLILAGMIALYIAGNCLLEKKFPRTFDQMNQTRDRFNSNAKKAIHFVGRRKGWW